MMSMLFLGIVCVFGLVILVGLVVGVMVVTRASGRDTVATARQDWMRPDETRDEGQ
jgi:hypothetical protein